MGIAVGLESPLFPSSTRADLVGIWDCSINGLSFRLDTASDSFKQGMQSMPLLRNQIDSSQVPGEQSISREELWRRSQSDWHHGAGQRWLDKEDSDPFRFWESKGIDPWTRGELSLLHATSASLAFATASTPLLASAGAWTYLTVGTTLMRTSSPTDPLAWQAISRPTSTEITSITTDGFNIYFTSSSGIQKTARDVVAASSWGTNPADGPYYLVSYVQGRLVAAAKQFLFEINGSGAGTKLNSTFGNADWTWTGITEGTSTIYAAGYSGNHSQIFRIQPPSDDPAAALGPPIPAAPALPTGEVVVALYGYLGLLCIGTSKGVRIATSDAQGNLTIGSLIPTPQPVKAFCGSDRFVWFGFSNYDSVSSGLGRLDLSVIEDTSALTPAYASDLMASTQGSVTGIANSGDRKVFCIANQGFYFERENYVISGELSTGRISYGIPDNKVAQRADIRHDSLNGSIEVQLATDNGPFISLGNNHITGTSSPVQAFPTDAAGEHFELKVVVTVGATTPVLKHIQLRAFPVVERGFMFLAPLLLDENDTETGFNRHPLDDFIALTSLLSYERTVVYQELSQSYKVTVEDYTWARGNKTADNKWWNGTLTLRLKVPAL